MHHIAATAARHQLSDLLNRIAYGGERIVLQRQGKDVAVLISMDDLELLQKLEDMDDLRAAAAALAESGDARPLKDVLQELDL